MRIRHVLLPLITLGAVFFAILYPQSLSQQWIKMDLNEIRQEKMDESQMLVMNYTLSATERLQLLRSSGVTAQNGEICYLRTANGIKVDVQTLDGTAEILEGSGNLSVWNGANGLVLEKETGLSNRMENYLLDGLMILEMYDVLDQGAGALRARCEKALEYLTVDYCNITDEKDPFFSMTLLCFTCYLSDGTMGKELQKDTRFSVIVDEETGTFYALSVTGEPTYVLTEDPSRFILMADLMGVICTEYELEDYEKNYPCARYNFGGYSYDLLQGITEEGRAYLDFNPEHV